MGLLQSPHFICSCLIRCVPNECFLSATSHISIRSTVPSTLNILLLPFGAPGLAQLSSAPLEIDHQRFSYQPPLPLLVVTTCYSEGEEENLQPTSSWGVLESKTVEPVSTCDEEDEGAPVVNLSSPPCHWCAYLDISTVAEGDILPSSLVFCFTKVTQISKRN